MTQPAQVVIDSRSERNHEYSRTVGAEPVLSVAELTQWVRELVQEGVSAVMDCAGRGVLTTTPEVGRSGIRSRNIYTSVFARPNQSDLTKLVEFLETGSLTVHVAASYPLKDSSLPVEYRMMMSRRAL
jgi:NADPH:quinone reductase-like Zn-dependent oxidoreductase